MFQPLVDSLRQPFVLGSDHYYTLGQEWGQNNPTPQHAAQVFVSLEMLRIMGMPPTVFELPGGSCSDWPPVTPEDAKACYLMNIALGMKGSNFYILTGGPNVPGTGTTSDVYDYGASIGPRGEIRPLYKAQKEVGLFLKRNSWLVEAEQETGVRLGLDFEMPIAESYGWKARGELAVAPAESWTFTHRGVLSTAFCAGLSPGFVDLGVESWKGDRGSPLVVVTSAVMARAVQDRLVRFLRDGGRLLLAPVTPTHDEHLEPCTVLSDYLGGVRTVKNPAQFNRVTATGVVNVFMNGEVFFLEDLPEDAEIVGVDEISGRTLAAQWKPTGGGEVLVLGFRWLHAKREHEAMLVGLLKGLGFKAKFACSNPNVWVTLRTAGKRSALFLMNLLSAPIETCVKCRPAWSGKTIDTKSHRLAPMTVKVVLLKAETE
jgi:beta-galactosidase